eukprot:11540856-Alexandrium_andersonii.AAC.1
MGAPRCDWEQECATMLRAHVRAPPPADAMHERDAFEDWRGICRHFSRASKRRALPEWSAPMESWHMLMMPDKRA